MFTIKAMLYGSYQAKKAIRNKERVIVTEGYTDVIALHQAGIEEAVSASGTALTEGHIHKIKRFTRNVVLLFDGDGAGQRAAKKGIELCLRLGLFPKVCVLPDQHDPDSYIHAFGGKRLSDHINSNAQDAIYYELAVLVGKAQSLDPQSKTAEIEQLILLVSLVSSSIQRGIYLRQIAHELHIDESTLHGELRRLKAVSSGKKPLPNSFSQEALFKQPNPT